MSGSRLLHGAILLRARIPRTATGTVRSITAPWTGYRTFAGDLRKTGMRVPETQETCREPSA